MSSEYSLAVVVPCYNHGDTLQALFEALAPLDCPLFLVDDGSNEENQALIDAAIERFSFVRLVRRSHNGGKGAAVIDGLRAAHTAGFTHAMQIDADGQHDVTDAAQLLALSRQKPDTLFSCFPIYDSSVPRGRLIGRYITHFWVFVETLSSTIVDSMCGFRVYPLASTIALLDATRVGERMDFDVEILVRLYWKNVPMEFVPTRVRYPEGGVSHFRVVKDNWIITKMHTRLFLESLVHWPELIGRHKREHWSEINERKGYVGMQLMIALYRLFGRRIFNLVLIPVLWVFMLTAREQRKISSEYIARVRTFACLKQRDLGEPLSVYRHFRSFAESILDKLAAWMGDIELGKDAVCEDEETKQILNPSEKKGRILFVSHLGVVEAARAIGENEFEVPVHALIFDKHAPRFTAMMKKLAPKSRLHVIAVNKIGIETAIELSECLSRGEWVAIACDRSPVRETDDDRSRSVQVEFLGEKAWFPAGPYYLASLLGAPVTVVFANRKEGTIRIWARDFASRVLLNRKHRESDIQAYAQRYAKILETRVVQYPMQWFNFFRFWQ